MLAWQPHRVLALSCSLLLAQLPALLPMSLTTGSRAESVVIEVTPGGAVTRLVRTDFAVPPRRGQLTEAEQLELSKLAGQLTPVAAAPAPKEFAASRLIITVGDLTVEVAGVEALPPPWRAVVQVLQTVEKRLLRPAPKKR